MKVQIIANFRVWVPCEGGRDKRVDYTRGMVIDEADVPAGQSARDWIEKGLAKAVKAASAGEEPAQEAGVAV